MSETARKWKLSERSVRKYCDKVQQDFELLEAYDMNLLTGDFNKFKGEEGDVHKRPPSSQITVATAGKCAAASGTVPGMADTA